MLEVRDLHSEDNVHALIRNSCTLTCCPLTWTERLRCSSA